MIRPAGPRPGLVVLTEIGDLAEFGLPAWCQWQDSEERWCDEPAAAWHDGGRLPLCTEHGRIFDGD